MHGNGFKYQINIFSFRPDFMIKCCTATLLLPPAFLNRTKYYGSGLTAAALCHPLLPVNVDDSIFHSPQLTSSWSELPHCSHSIDCRNVFPDAVMITHTGSLMMTLTFKEEHNAPVMQRCVAVCRVLQPSTKENVPHDYDDWEYLCVGLIINADAPYFHFRCSWRWNQYHNA